MDEWSVASERGQAQDKEELKLTESSVILSEACCSLSQLKVAFYGDGMLPCLEAQHMLAVFSVRIACGAIRFRGNSAAIALQEQARTHPSSLVSPSDFLRILAHQLDNSAFMLPYPTLRRILLDVSRRRLLVLMALPSMAWMLRTCSILAKVLH